MSGVRLLTPPGHGGVAVLRVEGAAARARLAELAGRPLPGAGRIVLAGLQARGERLDEALLLCSVDGALELHVHGSPALLAELEALLGTGAPETEGIEARARSRLATAPCEAAARILLDQAEGALRRTLEQALALPGPERRAILSELAARGRRARHALVPPVVVLAGPVNAGKSTLLNALLGRERALVGDVGGTTRDALREPARLGPWPLELVDTAGDRAVHGDAPAAAIERAGQRVARAARGAADLVLWLDPADGPSAPPPPSRVPLVVLRSRADRRAGRRLPRALSARDDPAGAQEVVLAALVDALGLPPAGPWEPGAGVPFEAGQQRAVERALADPERAAQPLAALLGTERVDDPGRAD